MLGGTGGTEEVGSDALGQDEVVVRDRVAVVDVDDAVLGVDVGHRGTTEVGARTVLSGEGTQAVGDVTWVQTTGRDLVQQRLECGVGVAVNEGDVAPCFGSLLSGRQATETSTNDHDSRLGVRQNRSATQARQANVRQQGIDVHLILRMMVIHTDCPKNVLYFAITRAPWVGRGRALQLAA